MTSLGQVFLVGPGFIGLEILDNLLAAGYPVTALVRRESAAKELQAKGVATIIGTIDDRDMLISAVLKSDIIVYTATADDLPSVEAVLDGISQRGKAGKKTVYIHTSGCSELTDADHIGDGSSRSEKIFSDNDPASIDALSDAAPHRKIDLAIINRRAELAPHAKISIILPPCIYGVGKASGRISIQIPTMVRFAIKHGYAGYVGGGEAVWSMVHVSDLARGYLTMLNWMETTSSDKVLANPYWFAVNEEELSWKEIAKEIGRDLYKAGKIQDATPKQIPQSLWNDLFGEWSPHVIGQNARNRADRLRALGWVTKEKSTFASLGDDEIPLILKDDAEFNGYFAPVAS